jgi:hypothetical protein
MLALRGAVVSPIDERWSLSDPIEQAKRVDEFNRRTR